MPLESYVVRIYRRAPDGGLVGLVEVPGIEGGRAFKNYDDLWHILSTSPRAPPSSDGRGEG